MPAMSFHDKKEEPKKDETESQSDKEDRLLDHQLGSKSEATRSKTTEHLPKLSGNLSTNMKNMRQRFGPLTYELYTLFLNNLLHQRIPSEEALKHAGMPALLPYCSVNSEVQTKMNIKEATIKSAVPGDYLTFTSPGSGRSNVNFAASPGYEPKTMSGGRRDSTPTTPMYDEDFQILAFHAQCGLSSESHSSATHSHKSQTRDNDNDNANDNSEKESPKDSSHRVTQQRPHDSSSPKSIIQENPSLNFETRAQQFVLWAKKMFVKVELAKNGKDFQVVSLMSKKSKKEIAPIESFEHIILKLHSCDGKPGDSHLSVKDTILGIRSQYSFGRRDFGMSEEAVRSVVAKCDAALCTAKTLNPGLTKDESLAHSDDKKWSLPTLPTSSATDVPAFMKDPFYHEIAQVIVAEEHDILKMPDNSEEKCIKQRIKAIKRAGNPQYYARSLKMRKAEDEKCGSSNDTLSPAALNQHFINPVEVMPMETAYNCLVSTAHEMRKELLVMYTGERRHYENLSRSLLAAQLIIKRCRTINNRLCNN